MLAETLKRSDPPDKRYLRLYTSATKTKGEKKKRFWQLYHVVYTEFIGGRFALHPQGFFHVHGIYATHEYLLTQQHRKKIQFPPQIYMLLTPGEQICFRENVTYSF